MTQTWKMKITDDSGFMGLIDPNAYRGFVHKDWQLKQLFTHFKKQISESRLLLWATGMEGYWSVEVKLDPIDQVTGFRNVQGSIDASAGLLCLVNYETLTMAAQFEDVRLPEPRLAKKCIELPKAIYACNVVQTFDPTYDPSRGDDFPEPNFIVELRTTDQRLPAWSKIPWSEGLDNL